MKNFLQLAQRLTKLPIFIIALSQALAIYMGQNYSIVPWLAFTAVLSTIVYLVVTLVVSRITVLNSNFLYKQARNNNELLREFNDRVIGMLSMAGAYLIALSLFTPIWSTAHPYLYGFIVYGIYFTITIAVAGALYLNYLAYKKGKK